MLKPSNCWSAAMACSLWVVLVSNGVGQIQQNVLQTFTGDNGANPYGNLILDTAGNIYGTTEMGGTAGLGEVFKLSPGNDGWTLALLHSFGGYPDGNSPEAGLVMDSGGNLYGTTVLGGTEDVGIVFELSPSPQGEWTETILHNFSPLKQDGVNPEAGLIFDSSGRLYGTTSGGGSLNCPPDAGCGTVFELTPDSGQWKETILHRFAGGTDGYEPVAALIFDGQGNLFGTTKYGGSSGCATDYSAGCGTVFELTPSQNGTWTENILQAFNGDDGTAPTSGVVFDSSGKLYGTAAFGGLIQCNGNTVGCGTVFRLSPKESGGWSAVVLYKFGGGRDGGYPNGVTFDKFGQLLGTTFIGGVNTESCELCGTVFALTESNGKLVERVLYDFEGGHDGGAFPATGLTLDGAGRAYGTTVSGGPIGAGVVFELTK
jgi:uncharacterized repeat protein (TIGR03803 family)